MKKTLRYILLFPFSFLYGTVVTLRNWLYDLELLKQHTKQVPLLVVGNLTVGGTGKTPHIEFLIEQLQTELRLAVLSRGYGRKTSGFRLVSPDATSVETGDEPLQLARKYPQLPVAVCENRSIGIDRLIQLYPETDLILLDDAFQHRRIKPGMSVLLTDFNRLHTRDSMLPGGTLREPVWGSRRASVMIVTKCPPDSSPIDLRIIELELKPRPGQEVLFSCFTYDRLKPLFPDQQEKNTTINSLSEHSVLLLTGIASPQPIVNLLTGKSKELSVLNFPDHHEFTRRDLHLAETRFKEMNGADKLIVVTEKDAVRISSNPHLSDSIKKHIFVLPVRVSMLNDQTEVFTQKIIDYVRENKRDL